MNAVLLVLVLQRRDDLWAALVADTVFAALEGPARHETLGNWATRASELRLKRVDALEQPPNLCADCCWNSESRQTIDTNHWIHLDFHGEERH